MNYLLSIKAAILIFPIIALLISIPFILQNYHKYGSINPFRVLIIYSFVLYMITIYFLVILPLPSRNEVVAHPNMIRLIPFEFIKDFMRETSLVLNKPGTYLKALIEPCFYTVVFNIFMTIPFGMYLRYYFKYSLRKTMITSFLLSLFFEITQLTGLYHIYPYAYRVFDVDDLLMNTLGGIFGYFIMGLFRRFLPTREEIDEKSMKNSMIVSGLRRIVLFGFDGFLYLVIALFICLFISMKRILLITFIIYYILIPYITNGYTLGGKFLNVRLEFIKYRLLKIILRILFLFTYYIGMIFMLMGATTSIVKGLNLNFSISFWIYLLALGVLVIFYLTNIVVLFKNKKIYYDRLFTVEYVNTIKM